MSNLYSGVDLTELALAVAGMGEGFASVVRMQKRAAVPMSSGLAVRLLEGGTHVDRASALTSADALAALGITVYAVGAAETPIDVVTYGEVTNDSWSFTPRSAVYLGPNGTLVHTRDPGWPFSRVVGFTVSATRLFVSPQLPVYQGG